ncbi:hypothetical protein BOTBODRAFT_39535 [Botryobasidium botryosum FD-172 SS1]|uniref:Transmembrane protein 242 n=1 Tax=Botryobasidium botryosum (strain FD-172 SS1) TaxID=930990 RepID=A0A067M3S1_BOTB1|nr:hypothetical protein BOTBODRAFT_39535 [Botryobasidium botryosum FD-172 SS1]
MSAHGDDEYTRSSTGANPTTAKIVALSIVGLSLGLAIPFALARRKSLDISRSAQHDITHSGISSLLSRGSASSSTNTITNATLAAARRPPPLHLSKPPPRTAVPKSGGVEDRIGAAVYAFKAFGVASAIVGVSAGVSVLAVQWVTGITDLEEFGSHMRRSIRTNMPVLQSRLYRRTPDPSSDSHENEDTRTQNEAFAANWTLPEAELRLQAALDEGGLLQWAKQALIEFEGEREANRNRVR